MRPGVALQLALRDCYENSWRLVPVNAALGALLVAVGVLGYSVHALLVLVVLAGPLAAALVHCSVQVVRTGNLRLADAVVGLRLHWRRGLALGAAGSAMLLLGVVALHVYSHSRFVWPLTFVTAYALVLIAIYGFVLWTLAIAEPERPLRGVASQAALLALARPGATLLLGLALLLVNAAGIAAAVMPFLTLTLAYTFVAVAHFALPRPTPEATA
jgi:hypothetical protein